MRRLRTRPAVTTLLVAVMLLAALWSGPALAAISVDDYAERLGRAEEAVATALPDIADAPVAAALVDRVRTLLPAGEAVETGGSTVGVDDAALRDALAALEGASGDAARKDAAESLAACLASMRSAIGTRSGEGATADPAALARIIEEERIGDSGMPEWLRDLEQRLRDWLAGLLPDLFADVPEPVYTWVLPTMSALALLLVALLVWRLWRRGVARRDAVGALADDGGGVPVVAVAEGLPDDVLAYADRAAAEGRYRDAVRALFGGAARALGQRGVLPRTRTRTTADLLNDVAAVRVTLLDSLSELAAIFEPAWYGHRDPGDAGFGAARSAFLAFSSVLEGGERP